MNSLYSVPTPKQPRSDELTRDARLRVQTLFFDANFTRDDIVLQTGYTYRQVCEALRHRLTPQKHKTGRKAVLNTPQRKRLIEQVTSSKDNREVPWPAIPRILGFDCGEYAIRTAFKKEGFIRALAPHKPGLSATNIQERLQWAEEHMNWTEEQWDSVCWTDETWVQPGKHRRTWITRRIGDSELYNLDCIVPRYQRKIGWMFWGSISGRYGRLRGLFWEKDWETINEGSYAGIIIPVIQEILQEHPELILQQDNAKGHSSRFVKLVFEAINITPIVWPANSPDLNPIENIWDDMKDYIEDRYPDVHSSYQRLRAAVLEAWEAVGFERIKELVRSMPERCRAVIEAGGGPTKY